MNDITNDLVPHYSKADFDDVATEFLAIFYPKALESPMPVPIRDIVTKKMGLRIREWHLTEDLSVYGQMCFTSGMVEIYLPETEEYKEVKVRWGTMIIDPDTLNQRNIGCQRNTFAHEGFHWWKHRYYHILQSVLDKRASRVYKCPTAKLDESKQGEWTDEMWMEWQAVNVAPRILMPVQTFGTMVERFEAESRNEPSVVRRYIPARRWIIEKLAEFYVVSKESAGIRLDELGLLIS
ncbi:MAG: hypothetical protein VB144_15665 [Clostridia bacterium]|nr:hypothetical protein [Clostridia bacterium]